MTEITDNIDRSRGNPPAKTWGPLLLSAVTAIVASVWLFHGLYGKLLGAEPRHLRIVQSLPGCAGTLGEAIILLVGAGEVLLAVWIISGRAPRLCAAAQTVALLSTNALELTFARPHLLWPAMLVPVNLVFLGLAWTAAELRRSETSHVTALKQKPGAVLPLYRLRRHPLVIDAHFDHCLVLTYALPPAVLEPLLPPGLTLDTYAGHGLLAVAMVRTRQLRPAPLPTMFSQDFVLAGYRVFTKFRTRAGHTLRGLRILRSDADSRRMVAGGNLLTHYNYHLCRACVISSHGRLSVDLHTPDGAADLSVVADVSHDGALPKGSPFTSLHDALRFAGPLPYTFDYESETHSIIAIKGVRESWRPRLVGVEVLRNTFLDRPPFAGTEAVLASAFYVSDIDYRWLRGVRHELGGGR